MKSPSGEEVIVFETGDGETSKDVRFGEETVWLTQLRMAERFQTTSRNVQIHLRNVFSSRELEAGATIKDFLVVRSEGRRRVRRAPKHNILEAVNSIGYRVSSKRAVRYRQWASSTLREHLVSGYSMNERRLSERGQNETRQTLDVLSRTLTNQALVHDSPPRQNSGRIRRMSRLAESVVEEAADTMPLLLTRPTTVRPNTRHLSFRRFRNGKILTCCI